MIRDAVTADAESICSIYNQYIAESVITFEEQPVTVKDMEQRIQRVLAGHPWLVLEQQGEMVGFAYAGPWKGRSAYRYAVESAIYLAAPFMGRGLGFQLYSKLLHKLEEAGFHTAIGGVSLPNPASVRLHEKLGFEKVAHFKEIGYKFDQWIDTGYWQLHFSSNTNSPPDSQGKNS